MINLFDTCSRTHDICGECGHCMTCKQQHSRGCIDHPIEVYRRERILAEQRGNGHLLSKRNGKSMTNTQLTEAKRLFAEMEQRHSERARKKGGRPRKDSQPSTPTDHATH